VDDSLLCHLVVIPHRLRWQTVVSRHGSNGFSQIPKSDDFSPGCRNPAGALHLRDRFHGGGNEAVICQSLASLRPKGSPCGSRANSSPGKLAGAFFFVATKSKSNRGVLIISRVAFSGRILCRWQCSLGLPSQLPPLASQVHELRVDLRPKFGSGGLR
jgi:hypothetical protein